MEVWPVVEHEAADEWVKGEPQSADEVGEKNYPLVRFRGRDDLPPVGQPVRDIRGQVSGSPQLFYVLLCDGGFHPLASRFGHDWSGVRRKVRTWVLELEC